jgi:hypothetical protein
VEFFQDKVHKFPEPTKKELLLEKQTALRAKEKAQETLSAAQSEGASTNVVVPAAEAAKLTDAVSEFVGPPSTPSTATTDQLIEKLDKALAKQDAKIEAFKRSNDENAGKKIEGTGWLQIPYFVYVGIIALVLIIAWHLAHTILTGLQLAGVANPAVGAGATVAVGAMNVAANLAGKGFHQVITGLEEFKTWVGKEFDAATQEKILGALRSRQQAAQDQDVQNVIKAATTK